MNPIVLANIISLAGCLLMVAIGLIRERKKILLTQCVQWIILTISHLMLGGVTAAISNIISIIRNLYSLRFRLTLPVKLGFLAVQAAITAFFNQMGLLGWLPFLAAGSFTLMMDTRDTKVLKLVIIFGQTLFAIYDISIKNYTSFAFDVATVISTIIGIIMLLRGKNKPEE